ncbi:serine/threonine-protein kinase [Haliangium sp.]|uniref:serine/threonine-protein kinase n=1 Tax=Haliangium sp. TaxID=2663208 RepID=UPI003D0F2000
MKPGTIIASRFEIRSRIRRGGEGQVYRGVDRSSGQPVAIKVLHEEACKSTRFEREVRLLTNFSHPDIVHYIAHGTIGNHRYLVMEWVEGRTLSQMLLEGFTMRESVDLTRRIAVALAAVHTRGMVHRDIKPSNVMFEHDELSQVRLLDFGIVRVVGQQSLTRTGAVVGTPGYMSPEQARGQWDVDARADVFSLGCLLYACLSGRPPFSGQHKLATLTAILFLDPIPLRFYCPEAPPALDALLERMLAKDPADRPADAAEVVRELDALGPLPKTSRRPHKLPGRLPAAIRNALLGEHTETTVSVDSSSSSLGAHTPPVFVLISLESEGTAGDGVQIDRELLDRIERAQAIVAGHGGASSYLMDGLFVAVFSAGLDRTERAARCALEVRRELPDVPIVVGTGGAISTGATLDHLVQTLVEETFRRLAMDAMDDPAIVGIRLGEGIARALIDDFELKRDGSVEYLISSRG